MKKCWRCGVVAHDSRQLCSACGAPRDRMLGWVGLGALLVVLIFTGVGVELLTRLKFAMGLGHEQLSFADLQHRVTSAVASAKSSIQRDAANSEAELHQYDSLRLPGSGGAPAAARADVAEDASTEGPSKPTVPPSVLLVAQQPAATRAKQTQLIDLHAVRMSLSGFFDDDRASAAERVASTILAATAPDATAGDATTGDAAPVEVAEASTPDSTTASVATSTPAPDAGGTDAVASDDGAHALAIAALSARDFPPAARVGVASDAGIDVAAEAAADLVPEEPLPSAAATTLPGQGHLYILREHSPPER